MLDTVDAALADSLLFFGGLIIIWLSAMLWALRQERDLWKTSFHKEQSMRIAMQDALTRQAGTAKIYKFKQRGER
jgi:hypothetical protein